MEAGAALEEWQGSADAWFLDGFSPALNPDSCHCTSRPLTTGSSVGVSVVVQLTFWAGEAGQSQLLGPLLVAVVARELGPVLINLVVIVRSGSAMTAELGVLQINGEVAALETRGGDAFLHLVMPRVLGMVASKIIGAQSPCLLLPGPGATHLNTLPLVALNSCT